jgi:hypothetical protein
VLVLATLRPQSWISLTASPDGDTDPYAQARELLIGSDIPVPAAFHVQQMDQVAKTGDARLALAAHLAQDGQVTQFLAGAPELLARYRNAPPAAAAVIQAAMDARRLGISHALPYTFLEKAAPGYLTDFEWDQLGEDWLEQALAYATAPCRGSPGPLTRIRPRPTHAGDAAADHPEPTFMLADYLDHIGRRRRQGPVPPSTSRAASMYIRDPTITDDYQALLVLVELLARYKNLGEHDALGLGVARHEYLVRLIDRADPGADQATALARLLARHGRPDELNIHVLGEDTSIALALVRLASLASGGLDVLEGDTDLSPAARRSGTLASYVFAGPSNGGGRPV